VSDGVVLAAVSAHVVFAPTGGGDWSAIVRGDQLTSRLILLLGREGVRSGVSTTTPNSSEGLGGTASWVVRCRHIHLAGQSVCKQSDKTQKEEARKHF
jgi:hypothetical protein